MVAHRLQRVAGHLGPGAVVDQQGDAAVRRDPPADGGGERDPRRADLGDLPDPALACGQTGGEVRPHLGWLQRQLAAGEIDHPLDPALVGRHQLMHRQGVEELVGDQQHRSRRHRVQRGVPADMLVGQATALQLAQMLAGLDQVQAQAGAERRYLGGGAQQVRHQRAAARPELHQQARIGLAEIRPCAGEPQSDQLAERLADLGRGDEVAAGAERIVPRIVAERRMAERQRHEARGRDRAAPLDLLCDHRLKGAQGRRGPAA